MVHRPRDLPEPKPAFLAMLASWPVASMPFFCTHTFKEWQGSVAWRNPDRLAMGHATRQQHPPSRQALRMLPCRLYRNSSTDRFPCLQADRRTQAAVLALRQLEQLHSPRQRGQRQSPAALAASTFSLYRFSRHLRVGFCGWQHARTDSDVSVRTQVHFSSGRVHTRVWHPCMSTRIQRCRWRQAMQTGPDRPSVGDAADICQVRAGGQLGACCATQAGAGGWVLTWGRSTGCRRCTLP